jgi:hypothetical protein
MWRCSLAVNQNGFNSRITSEALEERFRQVFPAQGGSELISDLYASGVIVPTIDFTSIAEGSFLPESLQQAWDFATTLNTVSGVATTTLVTTPGFFKIDLVVFAANSGGSSEIFIDDTATTKPIWKLSFSGAGLSNPSLTDDQFIVFLRAGDSLKITQTGANTTSNVWHRQVASVNGILVNPLGFSF